MSRNSNKLAKFFCLEILCHILILYIQCSHIYDPAIQLF